MRLRSFRIHHVKRVKEKFRKVVRRIWNLGWDFTKTNGFPKTLIPPKQEDPRFIGKAISTHCVRCSCVSCGNPRKHFGKITIQEKIAEINEREQVDNIKKR